MDIPDLNLFMVCIKPNPAAAADLPEGYTFDTCRPDEIDIWKAFPFDNPAQAAEYKPYMDEYFERVYRRKETEFFSRCTFVRNGAGEPVATAFLWDAYGTVPTLHWVKTRNEYEGMGIGRALMDLAKEEARRAGNRMLILETQSCNTNAIGFYLHEGFTLIGFDTCCYANNDLARREVRIELGWEVH